MIPHTPMFQVVELNRRKQGTHHIKWNESYTYNYSCRPKIFFIRLPHSILKHSEAIMLKTSINHQTEYAYEVVL